METEDLDNENEDRSPQLTWMHQEDFPRSIELMTDLLGDRADLADVGYWVEREDAVGIDWEGCIPRLSSSQASVMLVVWAMYQWEWTGGASRDLKVALRSYVDALTAEHSRRL